jgi:hypothetical protein
MSKQTAVEWLINVLDIDANDSATKEVINQAKEMEKQQTCQFAFDYQDEFFNNGKVPPIEQYYKETYGGDK